LDDNYHTYINRLMRMTLPESYRSQLQHIHESPKFMVNADGHRQPTLFPGYTIVTPPWSTDSCNAPLHSKLTLFQETLLRQLPSQLVEPLPPSSFHLTLADLIWDSAYRHVLNENSQFEEQLRSRIGEIFHQYQPIIGRGIPLQWQVVGLMVMPRAIGVCLVPHGEDSYHRLLELRRAVYQNSELVSLGIEQQYHLTAHITLGYFGTIPPDLDREAMASDLENLNQLWIDDGSPLLSIPRAELQKFDTMFHYYRDEDWPSLDF